jgi:hypothetical protein
MKSVVTMGFILVTSGATLFAQRDANATVQRTFPPNMCTATNGGIAPAQNSDGQLYIPGLSESNTLNCAVVTDTYFLAASAKLIEVYGYTPGITYFLAAACVTYHGGSGGTCDTLEGAPNSGDFSFTWDPLTTPTGATAWKTAAGTDSVYLQLFMANTASSYTTIFGYGFEN